MQNNDYVNKVALVTGGARRIGAHICRTLHASGMRVVVHFNSSEPDANELINSLNAIRENSAAKIKADLGDTDSLAPLVRDTCALFGRLDVLINNASRFYATPLATVTPGQWQDMVGTNLKAPLFLAQSAAPELARTKGCIINIIDIYAERPLADHPVYCVAKAGLVMLTKALAVDLAPDIRVNAVSPGAILWPENEPDDEQREAVLRRIPSGRSGMPNDIAQAVRFLVQEADYISGQVITVDGGRSVVS